MSIGSSKAFAGIRRFAGARNRCLALATSRPALGIAVRGMPLPVLSLSRSKKTAGSGRSGPVVAVGNQTTRPSSSSGRNLPSSPFELGRRLRRCLWSRPKNRLQQLSALTVAGGGGS